MELGARSYDILIGAGLLARAGEKIAAVAPGAACAIVTDSNVARLHLPALEESLNAAGSALHHDRRRAGRRLEIA